ncbi:hypothetical protein [Lacisediminihabitans profunda]|uniref:Uncharacterized protein n=1 Tax=Lacisediminihabitans profunda TaxID=2594790 RepID=A0A5C8UQR8_9MICO|nr:hypothetical protein [Lacisediminihabitans profunda]TXN29880.1 hypothetical protein FVP33_12130 [Lacisediminihabitans profunda]
MTRLDRLEFDDCSIDRIFPCVPVAPAGTVIKRHRRKEASVYTTDIPGMSRIPAGFVGVPTA